MRIVNAFATRWSPEFGGINAFNFDFLRALSSAFDGKICVRCVVPRADEKEVENAISSNVQLIVVDAKDGLFSSQATLDFLARELGSSGESDDVVWLGHDRITGEIALSAAKTFGGRSAVIHHMSYAHYEAYSESSKAAEEKVEEQERIFGAADLVLAVGPLLRDSLLDMTGSDRVPAMLIPGLAEIDARQTPKNFSAYICGRAGKDASKIKQVGLGVAAFAEAVKSAGLSPGLPDALQPKAEPRILVRGLDAETQSPSEGAASAEMELRLFAENYADRALNLTALPFTTNRQKIFRELSKSSLAMMPSWHEGFGLTAWEAIGAGVPLIVTEKSGVYRLLQEHEGGLLSSLVTPIDVRGRTEAPHFHNEDLKALSSAITRIAKDPATFRLRAAQLREALSRYTWSSCAEQFVGAMGWEFVKGQIPGPAVSAIPEHVAAPTKSQEESSAFLTMPEVVWSRGKGLSEGHLLRAEEAVVPFDPGREPFLSEQVEWANRTDFPVAVRLITGMGGVGKTRLAIELARRLRAASWSAGFLRSGLGSAGLDALSREIRRVGGSWLIVVDYAEARQSAVVGLVEKLISTGSVTVRLLLLARNGGEWWDQLSDKSAASSALLSGRATSGPFEVPALHVTSADRENAYRVAIGALAKVLAVDVPTAEPDLSLDHFSHPLYIQMAALAMLLGDSRISAEGLSRAIVSHEERYWVLSSRDSIVGLDPSTIMRFMALSTIVGGATSWQDLKDLWLLSKWGEVSELKAAFSIASRLYPAESVVGVQPLRPDLIGEALVARVLLSPQGSNLLDVVLSKGDRGQRAAALTMVSRLLSRRADLNQIVEEAVASNYARCADELVGACLQSGEALSNIAVQAFDKLTVASKLQVSGLLSRHFSTEIVPLLHLELRVDEVRTESAARRAKSRSAVDMFNYAQALNSLAIALSRSGYYDRALEVSTEAKSIAERLYAGNKDKYADLWAGTLGNFASRSADVGEEEDALKASKDSLAIREELVKKDRARHSRPFVGGLINYANRLDKVGKTDESLSVIERAVALAEDLVLTDPGEKVPLLAGVLHNHAAYLAEAGLVDESREVESRAYRMYEEAARENPGKYEHDWASSMHNHANGMEAVGDYEGALALTVRALGIFVQLTKWRPERFEEDLVRAMSQKAMTTLAISKDEEIFEDIAEGLSLSSRLAARLPLLHTETKVHWLLLEQTALWLVMNRVPSSDILDRIEREIEGGVNSARARAALMFDLESLRFYVSDETSRREKADRAIAIWNGLDGSLRRERDFDRMLLSLRKGLLPPLDSSVDWERRIISTLNRRGRRMPWSLLETARRLGLVD